MGKQIQLDLQATLKRYRPVSHEAYPIESGLRVTDLLEQLGIAEHEVNLVFINGVSVNLNAAIKGGECVTLYPPLGGG